MPHYRMWVQLLKCESLLVSFILYHSKLKKNKTLMIWPCVFWHFIDATSKQWTEKADLDLFGTVIVHLNHHFGSYRNVNVSPRQLSQTPCITALYTLYSYWKTFYCIWRLREQFTYALWPKICNHSDYNIFTHSSII